MWLALAAAPAAQALPPAPTPDSLTALYVLVGTAVVGQVIGLVVSVVKWLGSRTVQREDQDKAEVYRELEAHEARFRELEELLRNVDRSVGTIQSEVKQAVVNTETTKGVVATIQGAMDTRFEKQSAFYQGQVEKVLAGVEKQLEELEYTLRQDMTRAAHDASVMAKTRRK